MHSGRFWITGRDLRVAPHLLEALARRCSEFTVKQDGNRDAMLVTAVSDAFPYGEEGQALRVVLVASLTDNGTSVEITSAEPTTVEANSQVSVRDYRESRKVAEARMQAIADDHLTHRPRPLTQADDGTYSEMI